MSDRRLPDLAYEAISALQAQAKAALPGSDRGALAAAQGRMAAAEPWTTRIYRAVMDQKGVAVKTMPEIDDAWLDEMFADVVSTTTDTALR